MKTDSIMKVEYNDYKQKKLTKNHLNLFEKLICNG